MSMANKEEALHTVRDALVLALPGGFVRIFVDEGAPMARLLAEALTRGMMPDYISKLLAVFDAEEPEREGKSYLPLTAPAAVAHPTRYRLTMCGRLANTNL